MIGQFRSDSKWSLWERGDWERSSFLPSFHPSLMQISVFYYVVLHFQCISLSDLSSCSIRVCGQKHFWALGLSRWRATAVVVSMMDNGASSLICDQPINSFIRAEVRLWTSLWQPRADPWHLLNCFLADISHLNLTFSALNTPVNTPRLLWSARDLLYSKHQFSPLFLTCFSLWSFCW